MTISLVLESSAVTQPISVGIQRFCRRIWGSRPWLVRLLAPAHGGAVGDVLVPHQGHFNVAAAGGHYFPLPIGLAVLRRCRRCLSVGGRQTVFLVILEAGGLPHSVRV